MRWMIIDKTSNFLFFVLFSHFKKMELIIPFLKGVGCLDGVSPHLSVVDDSWCHHEDHSLPVCSTEELHTLQHQHHLL